MGCEIRTALAGVVIMSLQGSCLLQCEAIFLSASMSAGTLSAGRLTGPVGSKTLVCILYEGCKGIVHEGGGHLKSQLCIRGSSPSSAGLQKLQVHLSSMTGRSSTSQVTDKVSSVTGGRSVTGVRRCENLGGGAI
jgi:hypothetical protein